MINKVILVGHLGRDPEVRSTAAGRPVANFTLATNRRWRDAEGQKQEETEWHRIVVWGRQAEIAGQYLTRGKLIYLEGRLQTRSWEDRAGEKRYTTEVVCENFQMLGGRGDSGGGGGSYEPPGEATGGGGGGGYAGGGGSEPEDDDIPF